MISFQNISKIYGTRVKALVDINVDFKKGEFAVVAGKSGAGKSTFLKLIYADQKPTTGNVLVSNINVTSLPNNKLAYLRRNIGIVFQDFKLLWDRSVFDNVSYPLVLWGKKSIIINSTVEKIMLELDIWKYRNVMPYQLSGGEQQKVAIARAMVGEPWVIIADEPTGNLDTDSAIEIFEIFNRISANGTTIIFATHNEKLISLHQGSVVILEKGKLV